MGLWGRAALSALLLGLAQPMADPWPEWTGLLGFVGLVPMLGARAETRGARPALAWLLCGYLYGLSVVHWMGVIHWLALFGLPLHFGVAFLLFGLFHQRCRGSAERIWLGAAAWAAIEYLRSIGPFSFSWALLGYGPQRAGLLTGWAWLLGPYAAGYFTFLVNAGLVVLLARAKSRPQRRVAAAGVLALLFLSFFGTATAPHQAPRLAALLVQGGHPQEAKWELPPLQILGDYLQLTRHALGEMAQPVQLVVWPEAAVTDLLARRPDMRQALHAMVQETGVPLLFGVLDTAESPPIAHLKEGGDTGAESDSHDADAENAVYNSVYLFCPDGSEQRYDKMQLVPWGETIPFGDLFPPLRELVLGQGGGEMAAGAEPRLFELPGGRRFACLICFESTLAHLAARQVRAGAEFLVVVTNDAWFFQTAALPQHFWAAQARAIENGVPVLRVGNTGITGAISRTGQVEERLPSQLPGALRVEIALSHGIPGGPYSHGGDGFAVLSLFAVAGLPLLRRLKRRAPVQRGE